jgi:hypothetical protein
MTDTPVAATVCAAYRRGTGPPEHSRRALASRQARYRVAVGKRGAVHTGDGNPRRLAPIS